MGVGGEERVYVPQTEGAVHGARRQSFIITKVFKPFTISVSGGVGSRTCPNANCAV